MADIPGGSGGAGSGGDSKSDGGVGGNGDGGDPGNSGGPSTSSSPSSSSSSPSSPSSSSSSTSSPFRELRFGCGAGGPITLEITTTTGRNFSVRTNSDQTVEQLKKTISKRLTVSKDRICLLYRERELHDGTLLENGLMDGSKIILTPNVETGLLAQRAENTVMQALESLNDNQVNDFLSGKSPLNLSVRLGDHMMLIQLQLSTLNASSSQTQQAGAAGRAMTAGSGSGSGSGSGNAACKSAPATVLMKPGTSSSSAAVASPPPHLCSYHHYHQHLHQHTGNGTPTTGRVSSSRSSSSSGLKPTGNQPAPEGPRRYVVLQDPPEPGSRNEPAPLPFFGVGQPTEGGGMVMLIPGAGSEAEQLQTDNPPVVPGRAAETRRGSVTQSPTVYVMEKQPTTNTGEEDDLNGSYLLQRPAGVVKRLFNADTDQQPPDLPLAQPRNNHGSGKRTGTSRSVLIDEVCSVTAKRPAIGIDTVPAPDDPKARSGVTRVVSTRSSARPAESGAYLLADDVPRASGTTTAGTVQSPIKSLSNLVSARMAGDGAVDGGAGGSENGQEESTESGSSASPGCSDPITANLTSCLCRRFDGGCGGGSNGKSSDGANNPGHRHKTTKAHRHGELMVSNVPVRQAQGRKHSSDTTNQWGVAASNTSTASTTSSSSLENPALAEASRNLTQTLRKLSKRVFTSKVKHDAPSHASTSHTPPSTSRAHASAAGSSSTASAAASTSTASGSGAGAAASAPATASTGRGISSGAVIESMKHHGKGIYSGTFSGTLNPALQDKFGRPKRDISTIIHILNDLLSATPQCARAAGAGVGAGAAGRSSGAKMYLEQQQHQHQQQQHRQQSPVGSNRTSWLVPAPMASTSRTVPATLCPPAAAKNAVQNAATSSRKHPIGMESACGCDASATAPCKSTHNSLYSRPIGPGSSSATIGRSVVFSTSGGSSTSNPLSSGSKLVTVIAPAATNLPPSAGLPIVMCKCGAAMIKLIGGGSGTPTGGGGVGQCQSCQFKELELENSKMREKLENLRLVMQRQKERREARRQQVTPYGRDAGGKLPAPNVGEVVINSAQMTEPLRTPEKPGGQLLEQQQQQQQLNESSSQAQITTYEQPPPPSPGEQKRECEEQQQSVSPQLATDEASSAGTDEQSTDSVAADSAATASSAAASGSASATPAPAGASSPTDSADAAGAPNANSNTAPHLVEEVDTVA